MKSKLEEAKAPHLKINKSIKFKFYHISLPDTDIIYSYAAHFHYILKDIIYYKIIV